MKTSKAMYGFLSVFFVVSILVSSGTAQDEMKLVAADGDSADLFGISNDLSFYYAVVGASEDDNENGVNAGAAYIYEKDGTGWAFLQKVVAGDGAADDYFGYSVATGGDYIIIGAPWDDDHGEKSGAAYIFKRDGDNWVEQTKLTADDAGEDNRFGISVAITQDGSHAVVGAFFDDDFGTRTGSAYAFARLADGSWTQQPKILPDDAAEADWFGVSIAIDDDHLAVGSRYDDNENGTDIPGGVYIFQNIDSVWTEQTKIIASDGAEGDLFHKVALYGKHLVVGAYQDDDKGSNSGSAYIYKRDGEVWAEELKIVAPDTGDLAGDYFGGSVDIYGNRIIVSSYRNDEFGTDAGKAYLYRYDGTSWELERAIFPADIAEGDWFGLPATIYKTVLFMSSRKDDDDGPNSGSVHSFYFYSRTFTVTEGGSLTIGQALKRCNYDDGIKIEAGTYSESINMHTGVLLWGPDGPDKTIISKSGVPYIVATAEDATIIGITIADNYNGEQQAGNGIYSDDDNVRIRNCIIRNCNIGIYMNDRCSSIIYNNTIDGNMLHGIFMQKENGPQIYNNIITNNQVGGIHRNDNLPSNPPLVEYNDCFGNGTNYGFEQNTWTPDPGTGELYEDPLFVGGEPFDYHLMQNSPCIDAANPNTKKDPDGTRADMGALPFDQTTAVETSTKAEPAEFRLFSAYPNPFNPQTAIAFQLAKTAHVELTIFNLLGEQITRLADQKMQPGEHKRLWNGRDAEGRNVASGIYFYRLVARSAKNAGAIFVDSKKIILVK